MVRTSLFNGATFISFERSVGTASILATTMQKNWSGSFSPNQFATPTWIPSLMRCVTSLIHISISALCTNWDLLPTGRLAHLQASAADFQTGLDCTNTSLHGITDQIKRAYILKVLYNEDFRTFFELVVPALCLKALNLIVNKGGFGT